jgi:hypothetical protein
MTSYINASAEYREANRIEKLKEFIKQHCDYKDTPEDEPFFTNLYFTEDDDLIIGDGSKNEHLKKKLTKKSPKSYIYKGPTPQYEIKLDDQRCFKSISCSCPYFIK